MTPGDGRHRRIRELLALGAPAVVGTVVVLLVTRKGVYASPDSAFYVGTARNLLDDHGLTAPPGSPPLSHFPPLFSLVLAAVGWVSGLDPLDAAGPVNALLLGVTAVSVALVVRRRSGSVALGVVASVAVVVALDLLVYSASALSEPLFVALVLGAMIALAAAVEGGSRWAWAAAVVLTGGACLTRYVGIALVVAEVAVLSVVGGRKALSRTAVFAGLALTPLALWFAVAGSGNRPVVLHLFDGDYWVAGARSLSRWVPPLFVPWPLRGLATAAVVAGLAWVAASRPGRSDRRRGERQPDRRGGHRTDRLDGRRSDRRGERRPDRLDERLDERRSDRCEERRPDVLGRLLAAFAVAYVAVLVADRVFVDASARLDLRFLAVLHVVAVVGLLPWLHRSLAGPARRAVAVAGLAIVGLHVIQAGSWVADGFTDTSVGRRGLTAEAWRDSPVLAAVAALPPDVPVYTNAPEAIFLLTGRSTSSLPAHTDYLSDRRRPAYETELAVMNARLLTEDGVVVWLRPFAFRERFLSPIDSLDLKTSLTDGVGTLSRARR